MSKKIRISENQLRNVIKKILKEQKQQISELFDFEDDVIDSRSEISGMKACELCDDVVSEEEIAYNRGICSYCASKPQPGSDHKIPGLQWSTNESRKRK
jgi:hypothetical protein